MYRSHRHHTRNAAAVLPTTRFLYVFVQLLVLQTGLDLLICTSCSERHHGVTNNLLTIHLQPVQKVIYKTDRISVSPQNTMENAARRPVWTPRTDQCDRCRAVIQETFHVVTGSVKNKLSTSFVDFSTGVKEQEMLRRAAVVDVWSRREKFHRDESTTRRFCWSHKHVTLLLTLLCLFFKGGKILK